jgi:hypothetical protein
MSDVAATARATPTAAARLLAGWWVLCAVVAAAGACYALAKWIDHDVAYWLVASDRLLNGARLYRDMIELNPPVNYALSIVPFAIARVLALDPIPTFHALVVMLAIGMTVASVRTAQRTLAADALFARLLALPVLFAFLILPGSDFGQREHMLAMVLLPYFIIAASGAPLSVSRPARIVLGAAVGLVVAFKPYFALYLVVGEATILLRRRDLRLMFRADVMAALAVIATAVAVTLIAFPEYLAFIVPLGREIYHGYEQPLAGVILQFPVLASAAFAAAALLIASRLADTAARDLVRTLVAAAAAALAIYVAQHKGWPYHALPALIFATIALGAALVSRLEAGLARRGRPGPALALAAVAVLAPMAVAMPVWVADIRLRGAEIQPLVELVSRATPRRALFLSSHLPFAFPVVNYAGAEYPYRYHHLLPLPGLYSGYDPAAAGAPFRRPDQMGPTEARFFATMVEDALRFPPQLLMVDRRPQFPPLTALRFDFLAYFRQDPRFARLMDGYRYAGRVSGQDVYVRINGAGS